MSEDIQHPRFMGLTGRPLSTAVSVVATTGFLLFGYDRKLPTALRQKRIEQGHRGRYVWNHFSRAVQRVLP